MRASWFGILIVVSAAIGGCHGSSHQSTQTETTGAPAPGNSSGNGANDHTLRNHPVGQIDNMNGNAPAGARMEPKTDAGH